MNSGIGQNRSKWLGDLNYNSNSNNFGCKIAILSATLKEAGNWSCKLEEWEKTPQTRNTEVIKTIKNFVTIEVTSDFEIVGNDLTEHMIVKKGKHK